MTRGRVLAISVGVGAAAVVITALVTFVAFRDSAPPASPSAQARPAAPAAPGRKITARLYYVSADGTKLAATDREVAYGEGPVAQAAAIVSAQLAPVAAPLVSPIPPGTTLRAIYLTAKGEAYVDLSKEAGSAHTGGTQDEILTIYAIVNTLTANLPAITSVQILVDGKEVDTLAGHVDLRKPLGQNLTFVE